jgi:hypothetical protein
MTSLLTATSQEPVDAWTFIHAFSGLVFGILFPSLFAGIVVHQLVELWENTRGQGGGLAFYNYLRDQINAINPKLQKDLQTKKYVGDSTENSICDTLFFALGVQLGIRVRYVFFQSQTK